MKIKLLLMAVLLAVAGYSQLAAAHEVVGAIGGKKSKRGGTDIYTVTCFNDNNGEPSHLVSHVSDTPPRNPAEISVQVFYPATGVSSEISTDPRDSDSFSSPDVEMINGAGEYHINVSKTVSKKKGIERYFLIVHCETANGAHTGTTEPELIQNQ